MGWKAAGVLALASLAGVAGPAGRGAAEPCSSGTGPLAAEVALRAHLVKYPATPEQRAEKRDLARVQRLLGQDSRSYSRDARNLGTAGALLLALYPSDSAIQSLVQGVLDELHAGVLLDRDDLDLIASELAGGPPQDRALQGVSDADLHLAEDAAAQALDTVARSAALGAAARAIEKGYRRSLTGGGRRIRTTCGDEVWVEQGGQLLWKADEVTAIWQKIPGKLTLVATRLRQPADDSELELDVGSFSGPGTSSLDFGTGKWRDGHFLYFGIVESGSITVTSLDEAAGTAEGTFAFTSRGCVFDCTTRDITGGTFRLRHLKVL